MIRNWQTPYRQIDLDKTAEKRIGKNLLLMTYHKVHKDKRMFSISLIYANDVHV